MPLKSQNIQINNYDIERIPSVKFLGVLLDENFFYGKTTLNIQKTKFLKILDYYIRQEIFFPILNIYNLNIKKTVTRYIFN